MTSWTDRLMRAIAATVSGGGDRGCLSILIYHRVLPASQAPHGGGVTAEEFDSQMRVLRAHFTPLPLVEAVERLGKRSLPPRAACVTFDDGYADNATVALPILQRHGIPATFFVATGYLDGAMMWNDTVIEAVRALPATELDLERWGLGRLRLTDGELRKAAIVRILGALKYLPPDLREARARELAERAGAKPSGHLMMRAEHVRELRSAGMEVGAHSVSHPILTRVSPDVARYEIVESGRRLAELVREPVRLFAYPNGKPGEDYGPEHVKMVREAGYAAAASTAWGVATADTDRLQLPRFTPWDRHPVKFSLRLSLNCRNRSPQLVSAG
jgi:peptidoglycan/xylan/chitin deacetylase (PgdA/CDA1 family)